MSENEQTEQAFQSIFVAASTYFQNLLHLKRMFTFSF